MDPDDIVWRGPGEDPPTWTYAVVYEPRPRRWWHRLLRRQPRDRVIWSGTVDEDQR